MITFEVNDMSCGHCVGAINDAVIAVDPGAKVQIDLAPHCVHIEPGSADLAQLSTAIRVAGYSPVPIELSPELAGKPAGAHCGGGCCCH